MSSTATPIACTLDGTSRRTRIADIRALLARALKRSRRDTDRLHLVFDAHARDAVEDLVRKESACCAFLEFQLTEGDTEIELTIVVPPQAIESADDLFAQFSPSSKEAGCGCEPTLSKRSGPWTWAALGGGGAALACVGGCALVAPLAAMGVGAAWLSMLVALETWWWAVATVAAAVSATAWFVRSERRP